MGTIFPTEIQNNFNIDFEVDLNFNIFVKILKRNDLEIHETRNMSDRNRRFGASCAIIKVT